MYIEVVTTAVYLDDCVGLRHSMTFAGTKFWEIQKCSKSLVLKYTQNLNWVLLPPKQYSLIRWMIKIKNLKTFAIMFSGHGLK